MVHKYKRAVTFVPPPRLPKDDEPDLVIDRPQDERHDSLASRLHATFAETLPKVFESEGVQNMNTTSGSEEPASKKDRAIGAEHGSKSQHVSEENEDLEDEYSVVSMVVRIHMDPKNLLWWQVPALTNTI